MSLLTVDAEKCKRDGICSKVCPAGIIELKDKEDFPTLVDGGDTICIYCGHCVAVCPQAAMSHVAMRPEECPPVHSEWMVGPHQVEHLLRSRRSIRTYKKKPADKEVLASLINIARFAPSGHNRQPVQWLVIYQSDQVRRLSGIVIDWMRQLIAENSPLVTALNLPRVVAVWEGGYDIICRGAPHVIVAHAHQEDRAAPTACTIALTYLELAAMSFDLGTCWAGFFNAAATLWPPLQAELGLPEGHISFGAMMVGYPQFKYQRLPLRNAAKITWHLESR